MLSDVGENIYKYITDNSTDVIYIIGLDDVFHYVSPSAKSLFGYEPEDVIGKSVRDYLTPESYAMQSRKMKQALLKNNTDTSEKLTVQLINNKKETVSVEIHARFIVDKNNYLIGVLGIARELADK